MKQCVLLIILLTLFSSCTTIPEPIHTPSPTLASTPSLTPTPDPYGDPDGDGYQNSFEEIWGSDPFVYTSFEDLKNLKGVITGIAHIKKPYDLNDLNSTIYQQINVISEDIIEENGKSWETLNFEFISFPFVTDEINSYVYELSFPYKTPEELSEYLKPGVATDSCDLEKEMMEQLIKKSDSLHNLALSASKWNQSHLEKNRPELIKRYTETFGVDDRYETLTRISSCFMMENGLIGHSTTVANKIATDIREAGIPTGVAFSFDPTDVSEETLSRLDDWVCMFGHPQTVIWTPKYGWVVYDYNVGFDEARDPPALFISDIAPDFSDMDLAPWFNYSYTMYTSPNPSWLYYSEEINASEEFSDYVLPLTSNPCGE